MSEIRVVGSVEGFGGGTEAAGLAGDADGRRGVRRQVGQWLALGASMMLVAAVALPASAQSRPALEARIGSLAEQYLSADSALKAYEDSVAKLNVALDTASVGAFRITASPRLMPLAREAAARVERDLRWAFGESLSRLATERLVVRDVRSRGKVDSSLVQVSLSSKDGYEAGGGNTTADVAAVTVALEGLAVSRLSNDVGGEFWSWLRSPLPMDTMNAVGWSQTRLVVVSATASPARNCFDGRAAACAQLLGLTPTDDPIADWFDARRRREAVRQHLSGFDYRSEVRESCLRGDDESCRSVLHKSGFNPLPLQIRGSVVRQALALGGAGAYERLLATKGGVDARLAAAARVPLDSVVRAWQVNMRTTRVSSDAMRPSIAAASLGWIVLCIGLSMRSSRWR